MNILSKAQIKTKILTSVNNGFRALSLTPPTGDGTRLNIFADNSFEYIGDKNANRQRDRHYNSN